MLILWKDILLNLNSFLKFQNNLFPIDQSNFSMDIS